jgi:alpha-1,3-mannosyltransferase
MSDIVTTQGSASTKSSLQRRQIEHEVRTILGVRILVETADEAITLLDDRVQQGRPTVVAFANAHTLNVAATTPHYRDVLKSCLVLNDGIGADIASRVLYGRRFPENLNGTDFTPRYLRETKHRLSIVLIGSRSGVAERAAAKLTELCPQHRVVGVHHGFLTAPQTAEIVRTIRNSGADVVLVGMGNPQQEFWLRDNFAATGCRLGFAVGALFDFLAGEVPRAGDRIRAMRLEWVYRLAREPRRLWTRYLVGNPVFLMRVAAQWASGARAEF